MTSLFCRSHPVSTATPQCWCWVWKNRALPELGFSSGAGAVFPHGAGSWLMIWNYCMNAQPDLHLLEKESKIKININIYYKRYLFTSTYSTLKLSIVTFQSKSKLTQQTADVPVKPDNWSDRRLYSQTLYRQKTVQTRRRYRQDNCTDKTTVQTRRLYRKTTVQKDDWTGKTTVQ